jgi:hypothetical protein
MAVAVRKRPLIKLAAGARRASLTSQGLLKILKRTKSAIRDDGRWFVDPDVVDRIVAARRLLGIDRQHSREHSTSASTIPTKPLAATRE